MCRRSRLSQQSRHRRSLRKQFRLCDDREARAAQGPLAYLRLSPIASPRALSRVDRAGWSTAEDLRLLGLELLVGEESLVLQLSQLLELVERARLRRCGGWRRRSLLHVRLFRRSLFVVLLGVLFGVARGGVIVAILVLLAGLTPFPQDPWWQDSQFLNYFEEFALWMRSFLPGEIADNITYA